MREPKMTDTTKALIDGLAHAQVETGDKFAFAVDWCEDWLAENLGTPAEAVRAYCRARTDPTRPRHFTR